MPSGTSGRRGSDRGRSGAHGPCTAGERAWRRTILRLVQGLCEVPKDIRRAWIDELHRRQPQVLALEPDELIVKMVLINLDVAEDVADHKRHEARPRLVALRRPEGAER